MKLALNLEDNKLLIKSRMPLDKSFDLIGRDIEFAGTKAFMIFVDGFVKDDIMLRILEDLQWLDESASINDLRGFVERHIGYLEVDYFTDLDKMETAVLSGNVAIVFDNQTEGLLLDARTYPARGPSEPDLEKVTRGSRDGLVETIVFNTALIRRRVRDTRLIFEMKQVGKRSKSDVAIAYIDGLASDKILDELRNKIDEIEVDSLVMAEKSLEELLYKKKWYNPLPQTRFTERPDVAAAHLLEGHIAVIVDNSPSLLLLPTTIFHFTQHAEDYYQTPFIGTYTRWMRFLALLAALVVTPVWLLLVYYVDYLPEWLQFIGAKEEQTIPLFIQFLLLEFGLYVLRIASIHTPSALSTSLGIIGGLLLSEFAVTVGWVSPEAVLYMAIVGICTFSSPSIEFSLAIIVFRVVLLLLTGVFAFWGYAIWGFVIGMAYFIIMVFTTKTFGGFRYTWPLYPWNAQAMSNLIFRKPIIEIKRDRSTNKQ
ncbi:spore germination protein [Vallitalea okinawensis]|uniref:spore germination protein n=1 Tax=Vallitalea okinawensis TaxID=2078660 RepID=UPI000CFD6DC5|nr:spore germination protein [Vallitalea okinawensis]